MKLCLLACSSLCTAQSITIKTGTLIDGKAGVQRNVVVSVEGSQITRIEPPSVAKSTYDLSTHREPALWVLKIGAESLQTPTGSPVDLRKPTRILTGHVPSPVDRYVRYGRITSSFL